MAVATLSHLPAKLPFCLPPIAAGQLTSVFLGACGCRWSSLCDQLIFWPGRGTAAWLLHGGQTDPDDWYTWQPITLPGDPAGAFGVSLNDAPSFTVPGSNSSQSMWVYMVHDTSPEDGLLHLYYLHNETLVGRHLWSSCRRSCQTPPPPRRRASGTATRTCWT